MITFSKKVQIARGYRFVVSKRDKEHNWLGRQAYAYQARACYKSLYLTPQLLGQVTQVAVAT